MKQSVRHVFSQLTDALHQLTNEEYVYSVESLSGASIGQHVRHIVELFICLEAGYEKGVVNYEKRKRDVLLESNKGIVIELMNEIYNCLDKPDKTLILEAENYEEGLELISIQTNYHREIAYNLEHAIHHMALIRIGVNDCTTVVLPSEFGVAYSTLKYRQTYS